MGIWHVNITYTKIRGVLLVCNDWRGNTVSTYVKLNAQPMFNFINRYITRSFDALHLVRDKEHFSTKLINIRHIRVISKL